MEYLSSWMALSTEMLVELHPELGKNENPPVFNKFVYICIYLCKASAMLLHSSLNLCSWPTLNLLFRVILDAITDLLYTRHCTAKLEASYQMW